MYNTLLCIYACVCVCVCVYTVCTVAFDKICVCDTNFFFFLHLFSALFGNFLFTFLVNFLGYSNNSECFSLSLFLSLSLSLVTYSPS